jgi:hypothetical protein
MPPVATATAMETRSQTSTPLLSVLILTMRQRGSVKTTQVGEGQAFQASIVPAPPYSQKPAAERCFLNSGVESTEKSKTWNRSFTGIHRISNFLEKQFSKNAASSRVSCFVSVLLSKAVSMHVCHLSGGFG